MSNTPKISVIVPVYNVEKYLNRCIDSILAQTFTDWELLLIDDGSTDRSGEICDDYASRDSRIRVFHKENGGVSSARQKGQDKAWGEYTIHVDSDDWVESTMLSELYSKAKEKNADMLICDFWRDEGHNSEYVQQQPSKLDSETVLCELFQQLHGSCWNKLVKRTCYSSIVKFPSGINCCEDLIWSVQTVQLCSRICYINKAFYHYVLRTGDSQSKCISKERAIEDVKMLHVLGGLLVNYPMIQKKMYRKVVPYIMKRSMKTMAFDNAYFKKNFKKYIKDIISSKTHSIALRLICLLSAIGLYDMCKPLLKYMK